MPIFLLQESFILNKKHSQQIKEKQSIIANEDRLINQELKRIKSELSKKKLAIINDYKMYLSDLSKDLNKFNSKKYTHVQQHQAKKAINQ